MIFNANDFEERVCRQFRKPGNCRFESGYKLVKCLKDYAKFEAGQYYLLWMGHFVHLIVMDRFIYLSDEDKICWLEKGIFQELSEAQDVYGIFIPDQGMFRCLINSDKKHALLPLWHFDWRKVKSHAPFDTRAMYGKWEKFRCGDDPLFMGWGFYYGKALLHVFNIENGEWIQPEQLSYHEKIRFAEGYKVGGTRFSMHALRVDKAPSREYLNY